MKACFGFGALFFVLGAFLCPWLLEDREMSVFCSFGARLTVPVAPFRSSLLKDIKVAVFRQSLHKWNCPRGAFGTAPTLALTVF